jgi:hypothetical protein
MAAAAYKHEELQKVPRGYRVRSVKRGTHVVRIAFPPGRRKKGSGKVIEILHPKSETNPSCIVSNQAKNNPGELLIFGNPSSAAAKRATRDRAARIRGARLNPKRELSVPEKHQLRIARDTLRMPDAMVGVMGGPDKAKAREIIRRLTGKTPKENPLKRRDFDALLDPKAQKMFGKSYGSLPDEQKRKVWRAVWPHWRRMLSKEQKKHSNHSTRKRARNQSEARAAVRLFEKFHGRDPKEIAEKHVSAAMRKDYTALGDLEYLRVLTPLGQTAQFNFEDDGVKLASSPDGKQLYCIGGNQNLASCLSADSLEKDFIALGACVQVQYLARKVHANFEPTSYYHKFGEKTGARPQLAYDKLKRQIFFVGGEYFIDTKQGVSPGIEN